MNAPEDDRRETPASWGDYSSDETQIVRPPEGGYDKPASATEPAAEPAAEPFSKPTPAGSASPVGSPIDGETQVMQPISGDEPGGWNPSHVPSTPDYSPAPEYSRAPEYSNAPADYSAQPPMTSVYPPSTPGYAPAGYPAAYAPPAAVPAQASAVVPLTPASRVVPGFLSAIIGLVLVAGGLYLAVKYGNEAATDVASGKIGLKHTILAVAGAVLIFAALLLDGWSPWATLIPGIALTGLGGWAMFSLSAQQHMGNWIKSILSPNQLAPWLLLGFILILGLTLLAASIAVMVARSSGKRDGNIIGSRRSV